MKIFAIIFALTLTILSADELSNAYEKEYTFLKAQKSELQTRLKKEKSFQDKEVKKAQIKVQVLQDSLVSLSQNSKSLDAQIEKSVQMLDDKSSNSEITASVIIQAKSLLEAYGVSVTEGENIKPADTMNKAFTDAANLYKQLSSIHKKQGEFYLLDGTTAQGEIVKIGNIAAYGVSTKASGALAPAGNGEYKIWNKDTSADARTFQDAKRKKEINIFIYENLDKDIEYTEEKTLQDTLDGGGTIGYIILGLGVLGLLLVLLRVVLLITAGSNVKKITDIVIANVESGKSSEAIEAIKNFKGATARVIKATLRNIDKDRDHIEDIVTENILNESSNIDRFGNFVLVLAAVSPLLGLLGTVTGMIATFDIITEFGTGDPKLLSGGISEALVTTMLGLIVAIPLLLLGNLLSGWAQSIKDSMEQSALHIVNIFEINKA